MYEMIKNIIDKKYYNDTLQYSFQSSFLLYFMKMFAKEGFSFPVFKYFGDDHDTS